MIKMKLIICNAVAVIMIFCVGKALGQKEIKYEKIYYHDTKTETDEVIISIEDAISTDAETKFKLKIANKTNDYIIFQPAESKFMISGKEISPQEKTLVIEPNDSKSRVVNAKGNFNSVKSYSFIADGLYRVSTAAAAIPAPDFKLPPSKNDFTAGMFNCVLAKLDKETDETQVKFKCTYTGNKIGFVSPAKVAVTMPDGNDYANAKSKSATLVFLKKGEEDSFTLLWERMPGGKLNDMQKVEMIIKWNEAFREAESQKISVSTLELKMDEPTSYDKGR